MCVDSSLQVLVIVQLCSSLADVRDCILYFLKADCVSVLSNVTV